VTFKLDPDKAKLNHHDKCLDTQIHIDTLNKPIALPWPLKWSGKNLETWKTFAGFGYSCSQTEASAKDEER